MFGYCIKLQKSFAVPLTGNVYTCTLTWSPTLSCVKVIQLQLEETAKVQPLRPFCTCRFALQHSSGICQISSAIFKNSCNCGGFFFFFTFFLYSWNLIFKTKIWPILKKKNFKSMYFQILQLIFFFLPSKNIFPLAGENFIWPMGEWQPSPSYLHGLLVWLLQILFGFPEPLLHCISMWLRMP